MPFDLSRRIHNLFFPCSANLTKVLNEHRLSAEKLIETMQDKGVRKDICDSIACYSPPGERLHGLQTLQIFAHKP